MGILIDFGIELGLDIIKDRILDKRQKTRLIERLEEYLNHQRKMNVTVYLDEEIDFQGLANYIRRNAISDMKQIIFAESLQARKEARVSFQKKASYYAQTHCPKAEKRVQKITKQCCSILRKFCREQVNKNLLYLANEIEDTISGDIGTQLQTQTKELKSALEKNRHICIRSGSGTSIDQRIEESLKGTQKSTNRLQQQVEIAIGKQFTNKFRNLLLQYADSHERNAEPINRSLPRSLSPLRIERRGSSQVTIFTGKHFSIPELPNQRLMIFGIYYSFHSENIEKVYSLELLDYSCQLQPNGVKIKTFFVDDPSPDGNQLLAICFENNSAYVYQGILLGNNVRLQSIPTHIHLNKLYTTYQDIINLSPTSYNLPGLSKELYDKDVSSSTDVNEHWYAASLVETPPCIIDPDTATIVKREVYFDEEENIWKAKIRLKPYKSYFAIKVKAADADKTSLLDVAKYYRQGVLGFSKDISLAISLLKEDGSGEAMYELAHIFRNEEEYRDLESYASFLSQSAKSGYTPAHTELALSLYNSLQKLDSVNYKHIFSILNEAIENENIVSCFFKAFLLETTSQKPDNLKNAFELYYLAAENGYKPAQFRLSHDWEGDKENTEELYREFLDSINFQDGTAQFCAGSALFYGLGVPVYIEKGLDLLTFAAKLGNIDAQYEISHEHNYDDCETPIIIIGEAEL